jgi:pectinesterase
VDAAPINLPSRYVIYIKPGVYNEIVRVSSQHTHLMFLGAGINQTIITNNRSVSLTGTTTFQSATVGKYVI